MLKDKERTLVVNFEDLKLHHIQEASPSVLKIIYKDTAFYFKPIIKKNNDNLVVFFSRAYNPDKNTPPIFARSSWYKDYDANCLFVDDPTLHHSDVTVGWGVGVPNHHYLESMSEIIIKITKFLKVYPAQTIYYGSSAGGFLAMMMATLHKNSVAIANNPQVHVREYSQSSRYLNLLKANFTDMTEQEIMSQYSIRFNAMELMTKENYVPKTFYLLNRLSPLDMDEQYRPFTEFLEKRSQVEKEKVQFLLYGAEGGHNGIYPRDKNAGLVNAYLKGDLK